MFSVACLIAVAAAIMVLREAGPLLWINLTTGGRAAWALGLKAWFGILRFELAGALFVRQCGCACPALHLRRHGRTILLSSVVWSRRRSRAVVCFKFGTPLSTNVAPKVDITTGLTTTRLATTT